MSAIAALLDTAYAARWIIVAVVLLALVVLWTDEVLQRRAAEDYADRLEARNDELEADLAAQTWKADVLEVVVTSRRRSNVVALPRRREGSLR